jgi:DNA-binding LytR/AlgR family response regulator
MTTAAIPDQKGVAREMFVQQVVLGKAAMSALAQGKDTIAPLESGLDCAVESAAEKQLHEALDVASPRKASGDAARLIGALQQLEVLAKRQSPRIAFRAKGRIIFMDLAEIVALQAEGNYVSLQHPTNSYLLRESLSSMAEKLQTYGFIRIHRSVVVNASLVEEIRPLSTGEYRLRVRGGKEYMVSRTYKDNLKFLAYLWLGSERAEQQPLA